MQHKASTFKMADEAIFHGFQEWSDIFSKSLGKQSEKYYRKFLIDIASIFLGLKQSLLFDYAFVDLRNATRLIESIAENEWVDRRADILKVGENIFFTRLKPLISNLRKTIDSKEFTLIDVSGKLQEPRVLEDVIARRVMEQFRNIVDNLEEKLNDSDLHSLKVDEVMTRYRLIDLSGLFLDEQLWCIPSVFGFLLGYPVIYWCENASEDNCLTMVPLNRYKLTFKASVSSLCSSQIPHCCRTLVAGSCGKFKSCNHTLFSFTAPITLESSYQSQVSEWKKKIHLLGETLDISRDLTCEKTTMTLAQVSL